VEVLVVDSQTVGQVNPAKDRLGGSEVMELEAMVVEGPMG
jgi:hypothetical protein